MMEKLKIHENLSSDKNITLWRYTTVSTLYEILINNYIPMPSIINFNDKSEGIILREMIDSISDELTAEFVMQIYLNDIAVSSWHKSKNENAAMWDRYAKNGEGVAIKTNAELLVNCVYNHNFNLPHINSDNIDSDDPYNKNMYNRLVVKEIQYTKTNPSNFKIPNNTLLLTEPLNFDKPYDMLRHGYDITCFFYKMIDFKDEQEVRVLFTDTWGLINTVGEFSDKFMNLRYRESHSFYQDAKKRGNQGYKMNIGTPNNLIEEIIISPYAHKNMINTVQDIVNKICHESPNFTTCAS